MGRYVNYEEIVVRYPSMDSRGGASDISSAYIVYAESRLDGLMASHFTVPFSNNNLTAKDLVCELVYIKASKMKVKDQVEAEARLMTRIDNIKKGMEAMMTTSGDAIYASEAGAMYNSQEGYTSIFGFGNDADFIVDKDLIVNEDNDRD